MAAATEEIGTSVAETHLAAVLCPPSRGFMMHLTSKIVGISLCINRVLILKMDCPLARPQIGTLMVNFILPEGRKGAAG